jgi:hypothetical protein
MLGGAGEAFALRISIKSAADSRLNRVHPLDRVPPQPASFTGWPDATVR